MYSSQIIERIGIVNRKIRFSDYILLVLIRYIYLYLTFSILDGVWYKGYGSYGISFSLEHELISGFVYLITTFIYILRMREGSFTGILAHVLFCIYYVPLSCSYSLNELPLEYFVATTIYSVLLIVSLTSLHGEPKNCMEVRNASKALDRILNRRITWLVFSLLCIGYIAYKINYNGLDFTLSLSQDDVYTNREDYVDYRAEMAGSPAAYATTMLTSVIGYVYPVFLYISLLRKNTIGIVLSLLTLLCQFSVSSSKSSIFFIGILIYVFICEKKGVLDRFNSLFTKAFFALMLVTVFEYIIFNYSVIYWNLLRREMYIPSWMGSMYFDFFSQNPVLAFSDSAFLLQNIVPDRYALSSVGLISKFYFNNAIPSPNAGLFAEAFMQCGYLGLLVFPIILKIMLQKIGVVFDNFGMGLSALLAVKIAIQLTNTPILRTDSILSIFLFAVLLAASMYLSRRRLHNADRDINKICAASQE